MAMLTEHQAYAATFYFIEKIYLRGNSQSDDLALLLSWMALLPDGSTADPAMINDWREAVKYAVGGGKAGTLELE